LHSLFATSGRPPATGQVAGGANLVCFITGRGSVFGRKPAPSIKLATNFAMFRRMATRCYGGGSYPRPHGQPLPFVSA
jgi:altronate dehydratase